MSDTTRRVSVPALYLWAPLGLAILRIVTVLLFLDHGLIKLLHLRELGLPEMLRVATGLVEMVAGVLIALGLHTRAAALVAAAESTIAYWALDLGDAAILFCTVFFYLVFAGPGAWSLDATIHDRSRRRLMARAGEDGKESCLLSPNSSVTDVTFYSLCSRCFRMRAP